MRIRIFLLLFTVCSLVAAQTQQGIVKTRGRVVNGKVVVGKRLNGATITLSIGNPLVSGNNGAFSFNVPTGKNYSLVAAKKQGYILADPEYTRRSFKYSEGNPFYVVLEDEAQRQADINEATRKVRKTMNALLEKSEEEIEALKIQNKITEQEYQRRIKELYDAQEQSQQLVKEMAERYASTDYDQLDEFQQQIQMYIEEGELLKADSMIQSKGSLDKRVKEYHEAVSANTKERERLEQSVAATAKTYEELSQDLFNKHTIAIHHYQWEDALKFLKIRADLDTTMIDAVFEYAIFCIGQKELEESEKYLHICLRYYTIEKNIYKITIIQTYLGRLYTAFEDTERSEYYNRLALANAEEMIKQNSAVYRSLLIILYTSIGLNYQVNRLFQESEKYLMLALNNSEILFRQDPISYRILLTETQKFLGTLYAEMKDLSKSEKYMKLSFDNYNILFQENSEVYRDQLASTELLLGLLYTNIQDDSQSEYYLLLSKNNYEVLYKQNPDVYSSDFAKVLNSLGTLYANRKDYVNSENYYKLALENYKHIFSQNPDSYRSDMALVFWNLTLLYEDMDNKKQYELFLENAWNLYEILYKIRPSIYANALIELRNRKVFCMLAKRNIDEALTFSRITYFMDEANEKSKYFLAGCYNDKSLDYANTSDFIKAHEYINQSIKLFPTEANFYDTKGEIFLMQGKNEEALSMWKKVLELNPDFYKENPNTNRLSHELKKLGLIE